MIKKLSFLLTFISSVALAQTKQPLFDYGPKVALNLAKTSILNNPTTFTTHNKFDLGGGFFGRINFTPRMSLQAEAFYEAKGGAFKTTAQRNKYKYVSFPLLIAYSPIKNVFFEAGGQYSLALNQGYENTTRSIYGPGQMQDVAGIVGVRINMLDAMSLFSINLRYTHGLMNVADQKFGGSPLDFRSRSFQFALTYNFSDYYRWYRKYGKTGKKK